MLTTHIRKLSFCCPLTPTDDRTHTVIYFTGGRRRRDAGSPIARLTATIGSNFSISAVYTDKTRRRSTKSGGAVLFSGQGIVTPPASLFLFFLPAASATQLRVICPRKKLLRNESRSTFQ